MMYGKELLEKLTNQLNGTKESAARREEHIANCDFDSTDCFLSSWANGLTQQELRTKIDILNDNGLSEFRVLMDLNDNIVSDRLVYTKFGAAYPVNKENGTTEWINPSVKEATLTKKGYKVGTVLKPAWACIKGSGRGLSGNCWVEIFPSDINYWTGEAN